MIDFENQQFVVEIPSISQSSTNCFLSVQVCESTAGKRSQHRMPGGLQTSRGDATVSYLDIRSVTPGFERGNVSAILGVLNGIHELIAADIIMEDVAQTLGCAIQQLTTLQQLAYDTMLEAEAERGLVQGRFGRPVKRPN
jgi:hypothetical protein